MSGVSSEGYITKSEEVTSIQVDRLLIANTVARMTAGSINGQQISTLNTAAPILVIPAQGANTIVRLDLSASVVEMIPAADATISSSSTVGLVYGNAVANSAVSNEAYVFNSLIGNRVLEKTLPEVTSVSIGGGSSALQNTAAMVNQGLYMSMDTGNPTVPNLAASLRWELYYFVENGW